VVLVAIGVMPNREWLDDDAQAVLARPEILAVGDLAGGDHWELAVHQGRAAARTILGAPPAPTPFTGWWSDVHGVRLQGFGDPAGADAIELDGDPGERSFSAVALRDGRPVAALAVGRPREVPRLKALLTATPD
jgi:3-phenylpropionate/trans-cinnamate dioxygenase ferredoxin reductase subunit